MRTLIVIFILSSWFSVQAQHFGMGALKADFCTFEKILRQAHSGLYKYHSRPEMDSVFEHYGSLITDSTGYIDFYRNLSSIVTYIGSLHDNIYFPENFEDSVKALPQFFPYPVKVIDGKLLLNTEGEAIPPGAEIISINGISVDRMLPCLYKYYTTDGYNLTGKAEGIDRHFPWFFRLENGEVSMFTVEFRSFNSVRPDTTIVEPVSYAQYERLFKRRYSQPDEFSPAEEYSLFRIDSINTSILTVNTFSLGDQHTRTHRRYRRFLKRSFQAIKHNNTRHLILDLRMNGGGNDPNDLLTFSYLTKSSFKENLESYCIFNKVAFPEYYHSDDPGTKSAEIQDFEDDLRKQWDKNVGGKYYESSAFDVYWKPNKLSFDGDIYLLIGHSTASAASLLASMIRSEGSAITIGEESIGGYYGHTGWKSLSYRLPETGIIFDFDVIDLKQFVKPAADIPFGSGVIPNRIVFQTQDDFIRKRDAVLQYTLKYIRDKHKPGGERAKVLKAQSLSSALLK